MKRTFNPLYLFGIIIFSFFLSCGVTTEDCESDIRAYEYGREMHAMSFFSGGDLQGAINASRRGYSDMGLDGKFYYPYNSNNACVKRGFEDAKADKPSPYNKSGKSWRKFK